MWADRQFCMEQSGAVEACWAHNPEVRGSKPRSAKDTFWFHETFSINKCGSFGEITHLGVLKWN